MFRYALLGMISAAVLLATPIASTTAIAAAEFRLRYSDIGPPRGPRAEALKWWAAELNSRSKGRIEIEFFWGQSLIKAKDNLRALGAGLVETAQLIASGRPPPTSSDGCCPLCSFRKWGSSTARIPVSWPRVSRWIPHASRR